MHQKTYLRRAKTILCIAITLSLGLIVSAILAINVKDQTYYKIGKGKKNVASSSLANQALIDASHLLGAPVVVPTPSNEGFPSFRSIPLFRFPDKQELVDFYAVDSPPLHPPIPNTWWRDHKIELQYADALERDSDGDGFSNREEFVTQSDPSDPLKYPELIAKLRVEGSSHVKWRVYFSSDIGDGQYQFKYRDSRQRRLRSKYISKGSYFFDRHPAQSRFILQDVEDKEGDVAGFATPLKYAIVKDVNTSEVFSVQKGMKTPYSGKDYTITFSLKALNQGVKKFRLKENVKFNLPKGELDGNGKYHFRRVKDGHVEIDYMTKDLQKTILIPL